MEAMFCQTADSLKFANYLMQSHKQANDLIIQQESFIAELKLQISE